MDTNKIYGIINELIEEASDRLAAYEEFNKMIDQCIDQINKTDGIMHGEYIIHIKYRYTGDRWEETNELRLIDKDFNYQWYNDWYEGHDELVLLGVAAVDNLEI